MGVEVTVKPPEDPDRASARTLSMRQAGQSGVAMRIVNMAVLLITTPILVRSLGDASFGIFVTITALSAYLALSDLGIGASLLTALGQASGSGDLRRMSSLVINGAWILVAAGVVVGSLGLITSVLIDVPKVLGAPPGSESEALAAFRIYVLGFAFAIPMALGSRVQSAMQQGAEAAVWLSLVTTLSAVGSAAAAAGTGSLILTTSVWAITTFSVTLTQSIRALAQNRWITSYGLRFRRDEALTLLSTSGWLLILQISAVVAFQTDLLIVSAVLGADQAAVFHGTMRAFALVSLVTTALAAQFWPAAAEALGRSDQSWVRDTHRRLAWQLPALTAVASVGIVVLGRPLIGRWLGESLVPPLSLLVSFAIWTTYRSFVMPYAQLLHAAGVFRKRAPFAIANAVVNLIVSLYLALQIGLAGPLIGSLFAHILIFLAPTLILSRRVLNAEVSRPMPTSNP